MSPCLSRPQVFDVLAYLIEHRDRMVPKTELLDEIWGDRFVSESALTSRIRSARQAVGDNGRDQRVIRTVHGRGYRFVAELTAPAAVADASGPEERLGLDLLLSALEGGRGRALALAMPLGRSRSGAIDEVYEDAGAAGLLAVRGRMVQLTPFAVIIDAMDELVARRPDLLGQIPEPCRTEMEAVLDGTPPSTAGRLQLATRELVIAAAADGGVVLVLHNLELADAATLTLVDQLARLTRRHPLALVVAHERPDDVSAAFERVVAAPAPPRPTDRSVPELPAEVTSALSCIALLGEEFDVNRFRAAADLTAEAADRVLAVAVGAGALEVTEGGLRFTSDGDAARLAESVTTHRRTAIRQRLAAAAVTSGAPPSEVAEHLLAADDAAAAVPHALAAARQASSMHAHGDVLRWSGAVLEHAGGDERVELLALRGAALVARGDPAGPRAYREALTLAGPDWVPLLRLGIAQACIRAGDVDGAAEALEGLTVDGGPYDGAVLLLRGIVAFNRGDLEAADDAVVAARDPALAPGAPIVLLDAIALQGMIAHSRGEWFDRIRGELRATRDDPVGATTVFDGQLCVAEYLLYGPLPYDEVVSLARGLEGTAAESGARRAEAFALCLAGEALLLAGRLDEARVDLERSVAMHRELHADAGTALSLQRLAEVALAEGDRAEADRLAKESLTLARWSPLASHLVQRTYGTLIAAAPDAEAAVAVVDEALADNSRCTYCDIMQAVPATVALAAVGRVDEAKVQLGIAQSSAELWHGTAWQAAVAESEAAVARAEGRAVDADELLVRAGRLFAQAGQPLDAARCAEAREG